MYVAYFEEDLAMLIYGRRLYCYILCTFTLALFYNCILYYLGVINIYNVNGIL